MHHGVALWPSQMSTTPSVVVSTTCMSPASRPTNSWLPSGLQERLPTLDPVLSFDSSSPDSTSRTASSADPHVPTARRVPSGEKAGSPSIPPSKAAAQISSPDAASHITTVL